MMAHWLWRGGAVAVDADQLLRALETGNGQRVDAVGRGFGAMVGIIRKQATGRTAPHRSQEGSQRA